MPRYEVSDGHMRNSRTPESVALPKCAPDSVIEIHTAHWRAFVSVTRTHGSKRYDEVAACEGDWGEEEA